MTTLKPFDSLKYLTPEDVAREKTATLAEQDDRTPERRRLDQWTSENPRDQMALTLFAAWVNCPVDKLPPHMRGHTCQATMTAWARVTDAARAFTEQEQES